MDYNLEKHWFYFEEACVGIYFSPCQKFTLPSSGSSILSPKPIFWQEWQENREKAIAMLREEVERNGGIGFYGYIQLSDKGIKGVENAHLSFRFVHSGFYWSCKNIFEDGSFYWRYEQNILTFTEFTITIILYGYEQIRRSFIVKPGKTYDLGKIILKMVPEENLSVEIKVKVLLPNKEEHKGTKVEVIFEAGEGALLPDTYYTFSDGSFHLKGLQPGGYILKINHPDFLIGEFYFRKRFKKDERIDLGEIRAVQLAVVHIEYMGEKEPGKGFQEGIPVKAILRIKKGEYAFDLNSEVEVMAEETVCEPDIFLEQYQDELSFFVELCDNPENYIVDLGEISLDKIRKKSPQELIPSEYFYHQKSAKDHALDDEHKTSVSVKLSHCYLIRSYDRHFYLKVLKIET